MSENKVNKHRWRKQNREQKEDQKGIEGCTKQSRKERRKKLLLIITNKGISCVNCGKVFKTLAEEFFYMEVKSGLCLQKICHKLKPMTMQKFIG